MKLCLHKVIIPVAFGLRNLLSTLESTQVLLFFKLFLGNTGLKLILGYPEGLLENRDSILPLGSISLSGIFVHRVHYEKNSPVRVPERVLTAFYLISNMLQDRIKPTRIA